MKRGGPLLSVTQDKSRATSAKGWERSVYRVSEATQADGFAEAQSDRDPGAGAQRAERLRFSSFRRGCELWRSLKRAPSHRATPRGPAE